MSKQDTKREIYSKLWNIVAKPNKAFLLSVKNAMEMRLESMGVMSMILNEIKSKLTLFRPTTYRIKVPVHLDEIWVGSVGGMTITFESEGNRSPITIITGNLHKAALHGLLRRLYSLGLPLVSVNCVACD